MGLNGYYLFFKWGNTYYFKPHKYSKIKYDIFINQFQTLKQLFSKGSVEFERFSNSGIKVSFINQVPTLKTLSKIKEIPLQKDKIFLGYRGSIKRKIEPVYLDMNKLLHLANLGSSGKGKSNTLNMIILSIFYNFDKVKGFYFIDFKGGIESNVYEIVEEELKTGKIKTISNDRIKLHSFLKEMTELNKNLQEVIKKDKKKRIENEYIYILLDEVAMILNYKPTDTQMKKIYSETVEMLEELFTTGRSQGFRIMISTQTFVSNNSKITGNMKINCDTKLMHFSEEETSIQSVFPEKELLLNKGINPQEFKIGEFVLKTEGTNLIHSRAIYIPENVNELSNLLIKILKNYIPCKKPCK